MDLLVRYPLKDVGITMPRLRGLKLSTSGVDDFQQCWNHYAPSKGIETMRISVPQPQPLVGITMPRLRGLKLLRDTMANVFLVGITMPRLRGLKHPVRDGIGRDACVLESLCPV